MIPTLKKKIRGDQSMQSWGGSQYRDIVRGGPVKKKHPVYGLRGLYFGLHGLYFGLHGLYFGLD